MLKSKGKLNLLFAAALLVLVTLFPVKKTNCLPDTEIETISYANNALQEILGGKMILASVYLCDSYDIKESPSYDSNTVLTVFSGQTVLITGAAVDENYNVWSRVHIYGDEVEYDGYVIRTQIVTSDEDFLNWENDYNMSSDYWSSINPNVPRRLMKAAPRLFATSGRTYSDDVKQFPESYQDALQDLKDKHPNWIFVKQNINRDFQTVINNEIGDRSWVQNLSRFPDSYKNGTSGSGWCYASEGLIKFYVDPRNALTKDRIFQFELLTYNSSYHTKGALVNFLNSTFMTDANVAPGCETAGKHYSDIIWDTGVARGISPFHLASRIYQEQGSANTPMISGTYPGFEGLYNHFNISASGRTNNEVITNGLTYARNNGWTDSEKSIVGGAAQIGNGYILKGQDTVYLQKFDVADDTPYTHQYMQNIMAPTTESQTTEKMYSNAGTLDCAYVFKIPVYNNMPAYACPEPGTATTILNLTLPSTAASNGVSATPSVWIDGVEYASLQSNGCISIDVGNQTATNAVIYKYDSSGVCRGMYVWMLDYVNGEYVATYEPGLEDLLTYHGFSIRITGKSGIRFKTGIATTTRDNLVYSGVDGYKLVEYGTIAMINSNRDTYPFVKNGAKVSSGMAYGTDSTGSHVDAVFETVDGRYRFTSVFTGLPAEKYKTEFAFRGYIILNNGFRSVTLYGPPVANSIYALAQRLIGMNYYEAGSEPDLYIRQIVADADALGGN